jgi:deazaflavin-dependent oxidoreductase (nitroreductase family)
MADVGNFNDRIIEEFRANGGEVGGPFEGTPLLLLTTVGAKSGTTRVNPVAYLEEDGRRYVFASKAGAPSNPDWYHNLLANPNVSIEVGSENIDVLAKPVKGSERDRIYAEQASRYPAFAEYQEKTDRTIPVVVLDRH